MPIPVLQNKFLEIRLTEFSDKRIPVEVQDQVKISFSFRGNSVTLFEERPSFMDKNTWSKIPIAQIKYEHGSGEWTLFSADRNGKWNKYLDLYPTTDFEAILNEIDQDPTGFFWG